MGDTRISGLPAASAALGADELAINEAGTSKKLTVTQIQTFIGGTTLFVAATGASAKSKAAADYQCDGTADEVQINAAITALGGPGLVRLSSGAFSIAAGIRPTTGCRIEGAGAGATTITVANSADITAIYNSNVSSGNTDIEIAHLAINGNRANQTLESISCIDLQKVTRFRLEDLRLYDPRISCISLLTCVDGKIDGVRMSGGGNDNFLAWTACANITLSDCISTSTVAGISGSPILSCYEVSDDSHDITFVNCIASDSLHVGFNVDNHNGTTGPFNITYTNCTSRNNGTHGFYVVAQAATGPNGIVYTGCIAEANTSDGFRAEEGGGGGGAMGRVSYDGCLARTNGRYGFVGSGAGNLVFDGCTASDNTSYGFNLPSGVDRPTVTGCVSIGNSHGYNIVGDDGSYTGCRAYANVTGPGFTVGGNRNSLVGCRSTSNSGASTGQGFDVSSGTDHMLANCVGLSNTKDGLLVRNATGVVVTAGRYQSNTTYGVRSLTGTDNLKLRGVQTSSNTTADRSLTAVTGLMVIDDFATNTVALGTAAAAGTATTMMRSDDTILAFDATVPAAVGTAAAGAATVTARRDHVHPTGAGTPSTQASGDAAAIGTGPAAAMSDHKHGMPTLAIDLYVGPNNPQDMTATGTAFTTANSAMLQAFQVRVPVTVTTCYVRVGVSSGNFDMGIYNAAGHRLASTGATAVPTAAVTVSVAFSGAASVSLVPGVRYYAAVAADNNTVGFGGYVAAGAPTIPGYNLRGAVATSYPLPADIAVPTSNGGQAIGIWFA
jgi:hypothetical protein